MTVQSLASEADAELDEVIVTLWDLGLDVEDRDDAIPRPWHKRARRALGVDTHSQQKNVEYWLERTGLDRGDLTEVLAEFGISLRPEVRRLPKGALAKLRRRFLHVAGQIATYSEADVAPCAPFVWTEIGHRRSEICYITEQEAVQIHEALVTDFAADDDPISPPGVKSQNLLSSALARPLTSIGSESKYPTIEMAGAALLHSMVMNHPFHNGNKRTGLVSLLVFLDKNGLMPTCDEQDLFRLVLLVAQHGLVPMHCPDLADREVLQIAVWIRGNSRLIEKGERPLPWHRLRRILRSFGCESNVNSRVGNRINISREVSKRGLFGRRAGTRTLALQVAYGDEGRTVAKNTVNHIRSELELDEHHGVDSKVFYEAEALPDDFIQQYRTLLRRLSKL